TSEVSMGLDWQGAWGRGLRAMVVGLACTASIGAAKAESAAFRQAVAEAVAGDPALSSFYRARNYEPLWTNADDADRRAALFSALDHAGAHGLAPSRYDAEGLRAAMAAVASERQRGTIEAQLSAVFLTYAGDVQTGMLDPKSVDAGIVREVPRRDRLATITAFAAARPQVFVRSLPPQNREYAQLMKAKRDLELAIAGGGWGVTVPARSLAPGDAGEPVVALRDRLAAMGYLGRSATAAFDGQIQKAVQRFQI